MDEERSRSVLLVDDEDDIRLMWRVVLGQHQDVFNPVVEATDGRKAVELVTGECFDVILTNFSMPEMSGFEVIEACRDLCPSAVIVMASASNVAEDEALRKGADAFFTKTESIDAIMPYLLKRIADEASSN